ncbi:putative transposase [Jannaschia faecimaris]|uniref:Putative transposase n=1 Tax=Jannaschia faecimaris TaxID=1244108 RepID=A0A1H3U7A8_9RHOB|nr:putative transposase [Jannaschia faecimaris]
MFVKINRERHSLWRAVDHEDEIPESFVKTKVGKKAALRFLRNALRKHGRSVSIMTDMLSSHGAARQEAVRLANNRAENSHLPFRGLAVSFQ